LDARGYWDDLKTGPFRTPATPATSKAQGERVMAC